MHYLIDVGKDNHFPNVGRGFLKLIIDPLLNPILSDWYMIQDIQKDDINADISKYSLSLFIILLITIIFTLQQV